MQGKAALKLPFFFRTLTSVPDDLKFQSSTLLG